MVSKKRLAILGLVSLAVAASATAVIAYNERVEKLNRQEEENQKEHKHSSVASEEFCKTANVDTLFVGCNNFF